MIYICADDYGLCTDASERIRLCTEKGALNKVSVFPNFNHLPDDEIYTEMNIDVSLHINLVEGRSLADRDKVSLLADKDGMFKYDFMGLLKLSLIKKAEFEAQIYEELKAQVKFWIENISQGKPILVDSHQHVHMIPSVFRTLMKVLAEEDVPVKYLRIPAEPILPYIMTPSLYHTYSIVNLIKQWLLKFLWMLNKKEYNKYKFPTGYFFGILFSGNMDISRVSKVLPRYIKMADKHKKDVEVLFHPGYVEQRKADLENQGIAFQKFYYSSGRKTEFDAVMNLKI